MIGESDDAPYIPLIAVGDISTGVTAAFGIAAALLNRSRTGEGQHLDIALLDCYYHYHEVNVHQYSGSNGEIKPMRCGRHLTYVCPAGVFKATNGHIILIAFLHHWADLCTAMGRPELVEEEAFATDGGLRRPGPSSSLRRACNSRRRHHSGAPALDRSRPAP